MKINKNEELNKGELILADLYSRDNYVNGKYNAGHIFGLYDIDIELKNDVFFLETLQVRADSADRMIAEAEMQGKDTSNPEIMEAVGKEINALGKPLHRREVIIATVITSLELTAEYVVAIGIWGLVFKKNFLVLGFIVGFIISLLTTTPVVAIQRTRERIREVESWAGYIWGNLAIMIGTVGLVALIIRVIFFH